MTASQIDILLTLVAIWPVVLILKRLGLKPVMAGLLLFSFILPLLGHMLVAFYAACNRWPSFPSIVKPAPRVKL